MNDLNDTDAHREADTESLSAAEAADAPAGPAGLAGLAGLAGAQEDDGVPMNQDSRNEDGMDETTMQQENAGEKGPAQAATTQKAARKPSRTRKEIAGRKAKKETARAAREARGAEQALRVKKEKRPPFDLAALDPEAMAMVKESLATIDTIGRKSTDDVFVLGEAFEAMAAAIPDPVHWREAVTKHCAVTVKSADNWRRIARSLSHRREALVRHKVTPTVLIHLTSASAEQVDRVIAAFEAGQRMTVGAVQAMVRSGAEADGAEGNAAAAMGGAKGLRVQALAKVARQSKAASDELKAIRDALLEALAAAGEKRLRKGELVTALAPRARRAQRDLVELLCDIDPASLVGGQALRHLTAPDESWAGVLAILYRLGGDHWAEATQLKAFVEGEVLPALAFALDGKAPGAAGPQAVGPEAADTEPHEVAAEMAGAVEATGDVADVAEAAEAKVDALKVVATGVPVSEAFIVKGARSVRPKAKLKLVADAAIASATIAEPGGTANA